MQNKQLVQWTGIFINQYLISSYMENQRWYQISAQLGHQGAGISLDINIYVWVKDTAEAFTKYKKMGGIKNCKKKMVFYF